MSSLRTKEEDITTVSVTQLPSGPEPSSSIIPIASSVAVEEQLHQPD